MIESFDYEKGILAGLLENPEYETFIKIEIKKQIKLILKT
jgi:hypothetical protein